MSSRQKERRLVAIVITLVALAGVVWVTLRGATPYPTQSRVVVSGSQAPSPEESRFTPEYVGVDRQTGDVTVVARDGQGRLSTLIVPKATAPSTSQLTAPTSEDAEANGN
ncbi:MAG: hypothetical protein N2512_00015 [Armatimonadetes bacterium]|nr:hypothetical protein [Armatimonadota bacterium]